MAIWHRILHWYYRFQIITEENIILYVGDLDGWTAPYSQIKDKLIEIS